jgi:hypothetical protein
MHKYVRTTVRTAEALGLGSIIAAALDELLAPLPIYIYMNI